MPHMKKWLMSLCCLGGLLFSGFFFSCGNGKTDTAYLKADSLNRNAYEWCYKNLGRTEEMARNALEIGRKYSSIKAEALNNLAFCAFIRMDFAKADSLLNEVYRETANELECLIADVGMMKICQRTSMNKEFYDYRNSALRRMKRIGEDVVALSEPHIRYRFNYACTEFDITSAIYSFYLQQQEQSMASIDAINVDQELKGDTAQLLYYYYMKGSGEMYQADTPEDVVVGEFDYLMDCLMLSHEKGYVYFEANASQAMAELLKDRNHYDLLLQRRPGMMRVANHRDLPWEEFLIAFAENALNLFKEYGDWYQISGTYRTLASCYNELGCHEAALECLKKALSYVNLHHEHFYHCHDTLDRLQPYIPEMGHSIELKWINSEGIMTVPEWIARLREQLSVTYAALGMKPQSDYNRNIYLDILDYTRQDKELESRYQALDTESKLLNGLLILVISGFIVLTILLILLSKKWKRHNALYVAKLKKTLEVCRLITVSVPSDAQDMESVVDAIMNVAKHRILSLVGISDMRIFLAEESIQDSSEKGMEFLLKGSKGQVLGVCKFLSKKPMLKEDKTLVKIILPYISWTLENAQMLVSLSDERLRLEKERYVHELHLVEYKRQNLIKKSCLSIVRDIAPYIDRIINEVHKLIANNYWDDKNLKEGKYKYINELVTRIIEYNNILALWVKMRQGVLSLHIETFALNELFEVLQKGRRLFEVKKQNLLIEPTNSWVKADKALTLFMINTLTENARKYTQEGGEIQVYASETEDYIEISVQDNGSGLSEEDVNYILNEKVYDSGKIGLKTTSDTDQLLKNKGSGFGLMNCKGIIDTYRKTNELFRVCCFSIESCQGKGSRFYFRLPKGLRQVLGIWLLMVLPGLMGCREGNTLQTDIGSSDSLAMEAIINDSLLYKANVYANKVYSSNLEGHYDLAIVYADSALVCLNLHFEKYADFVAPQLKLVGKGTAAELDWFSSHFYTDYYVLLDVRNEAAVAYLAMGNRDAYRYNNQAYTSLYKQISVDASLEEYCSQMQMSAKNKIVAIILCLFLLIFLLIGYYLLYLRHRLMYRYGLEQVLEINGRALTVPVSPHGELSAYISELVMVLHREVNELVALDVLGIMVWGDDGHKYDAFSVQLLDNESMRGMMIRSFSSGEMIWKEDEKIICLPLQIEVGEEMHSLGVFALCCSSYANYENDRLMLELVAGYISVMIYHAVELIAGKCRDVEISQDEVRRTIQETNRLHVQNMVLDNCLSTIKHETVYYPNRVKQIIERLLQGLDEKEELKQIESIQELIGYYKDVYTLLGACAARQLEEVTFKRNTVDAKDLAEAVSKYFRRASKKCSFQVDWVVNSESVKMMGDEVELKYMLENLVDEALTCSENGTLELNIYREGDFVRFDFVDRRRDFSQDYLNHLFYPNLSKMQAEKKEGLVGAEYLLCKQIIRDHDEYAGRRGCRINACPALDGGFMVWCTIPMK